MTQSVKRFGSGVLVCWSLDDQCLPVIEAPLMVDLVQQPNQQEGVGAAQAWWEQLVTQIRLDVSKMNAGIVPKGWPTMKGQIEINGRQSLPGPLELHIDKPPFPAREDHLDEPPTYLAIQLDIDEGTFKTLHNHTRGAYAYGRGKNENCDRIGILQVHFVADDDQVHLIIDDGRELKIEPFSEGILQAFLPRFNRCGTMNPR